MEFTQEQQAAISVRGRVIVSASAGSGKTAVMIERLVSLILGGADVKKVLAVTFTKKAAAQMREKLRTALVKRIATSSEEEKNRLKEQLSALPAADICTIHAFCARLVRANFFLVDTQPTFRIVSPDDGDGKELSARALEELFEEAYEEGDEGFSQLLSVYFRQKKDEKLRTLVRDLHGKFRGLPNYREKLSLVGQENAFEEVCAYLAEDFCMRANEIVRKVEALSDFFAESNPKALLVCDGIVSAAEEICKANGLFAMTALSAPVIARMPPMTKAAGEELARLKTLSSCSSAIKEVYSDLKKYASQEEELARYQDGQARAAALAALVLRYDDIYTRFKEEKGLLDYNDLEHDALRILANEEALAGIRERYEYLFVDEYQDVNLAQEQILSLIGGDEIFLVGDRKQAIYGFRGSKSAYFTQKTVEFERSLVLSENFRSSSAVLEGVNRVFARAMTKDSCGFDYAPDSLMQGGRRYASHEGKVVFHRIYKEKSEKIPPREIYSVLHGGREEKIDRQAEEIVRIVKEELGSDWYDVDADEGKREKKVSYGDIAVLVRKKSGDAERVVAALSACDIPVTTTAKVNVCDFWEIRLLVDWLSYLDNAEQDIPLVSAMLSSVGGFCEEELAQIRLRFSSAYFFRAACNEYATKMADSLSVRLRDFFQITAKLRVLSQVLPAREMLCRLLAMGLETEICAKKDGDLRLKRVNRFLDEAEGSVHAFLRRLSRADFHIDFSESGGEDAVKVVTMHASKGLEYPVVILASLDAPFHGAEKDEVMFSERFSVAPKSFHVEKKFVYDTVLRRATAVYQEREEVKDELNLLYVAMTRARYRLHMLFGEREGNGSVQYAKRFSDFIDFTACEEYFVEPSGEEVPMPERKAFAFRADEQLKAEILAHYRVEYPFAQSVTVPVKSSASELIKREKTAILSPSNGTARSTEEGTAYHAFLQHYRFGGVLKEELSRMRREELLSEEQFSLLEEEKLQEILQMPALQGLQEKMLFREQTFLVSLPWREIKGGACTDEVVFQGAIDLLCLDGQGATVLDYKFSSHSDEQIRADYALQISLYKKAVARALRIDESTVQAKILNILQCREIIM